MTKHKLQLDAVRKISETVKEKIDTHYKYIEEFNEKNQDLDSVEKELEKLEDQLILLKEVIQNANKNKHKDSKRSNNYYIYRLSNLKTREIWLRELRIKDNDDAYITEEEIDEQLRNISEIGRAHV